MSWTIWVPTYCSEVIHMYRAIDQIKVGCQYMGIFNGVILMQACHSGFEVGVCQKWPVALCGCEEDDVNARM